MRVLVDDIGTVVASMRSDARVAALLNDAKINGLFPFYEYGHRREIARLLMEKENDLVRKYQKYPLVALRMDFPEVQNPGQLVEYDLNIAFLAFTQENYSTAQRYANIFKPLLYPLVGVFFEKLVESGLFVWGDTTQKPPHTKIDRPYYGIEALEDNEANIFNDPLDGIELINLRIRSTDTGCD